MRRLLLSLAAWSTLVSACSDDSPTETFVGSVALAVGTPALTIPVGGSASNAITISRHGDYSGTVTLTVTGLPAGVTGIFTHPTVLPTSTASTLSLTVAASAAPGTSIFTVHGTGTGAADATAQVQLTITPVAQAAGVSAHRYGKY